MAWSSFEFWLTRDDGERILFLEPRWWQYVTVVNGPGWFALGLEEEIDRQLAVDRRIEIWRRPPDTRLSLEMVGLIRDWEPWSTDDWEGTRVTGPDIGDLLDRRIIAYAAGESESTKTDFADDMMKEMWGQNLGGGAIAARDLTGFGLSLAPDLGDGPSITKAFAWRNLLKALRGVNAAAKSEGNEVFFAMVPTTNTLFQFQTFTGQPGVDRTQTGSANPITISQEWGNLRTPAIKYKHSRERNYVYAGGQGLEDDRTIAEVSDPVRIAASQWNRREVFTSSNSKVVAAITGAANDKLAKERPTIKFMGSLVDIPEARYGVHWRLGDRVTASFRGQMFDVIIRAVQVSVNTSGHENITTKLEYQS